MNVSIDLLSIHQSEGAGNVEKFTWDRRLQRVVALAFATTAPF